MEGIEARRVKPSTLAWATNALRGEKEQNGKQKKDQKEINSSLKVLESIIFRSFIFLKNLLILSSIYIRVCVCVCVFV